MNEKKFIVWLRGFVDLVGRAPTWNEWQIIKDHVELAVQNSKPLFGQPLYLGHELTLKAEKPIVNTSC